MAQGDTIDCEEPKCATCDCCGQRSTRMARFVGRDDDALAMMQPDRAVIEFLGQAS